MGPSEVKALNQQPLASIGERLPGVDDEIARVFEIVAARGVAGARRVHFVGDVTDVIANLWTFNDRLPAEGSVSGRRRRVQFFVTDPASGHFAPSKFCAFVSAPRGDGECPPPTMTFDVYDSRGGGSGRHGEGGRNAGPSKKTTAL